MGESKNTNKGFSLVEMLVAITILVIVVAPLTKVLVSSSKVNQKSKRTMSATEMAQNMFESIEANSPETAIIELSSLAKSKNLILDNPQSIIPNGMTYDSVKEYSGVAEDSSTGTLALSGYTAGGGAYVQSIVEDAVAGTYRCKGFKESTTDKYVFTISSMSHDNTYYDMVVQFDASAYDTTYVPSIYTTDYVSIPKIYNVNSMYDGVAIDGALALNNVLSGEFRGKRINNGKVESELLKNLKRTYKIDIEDIGASGTPQIVVNLTREYEYKLSSELVAGMGGVYTEPTENIFDSSMSGSVPRNIFIYYTPNYNSISVGDSALDHFVINNLSDCDINIYIIRMQQTGAEALNLLNESTIPREDAYTATVQIYEGNTSQFNTNIRTNLDDNIMKVDTISDYKDRARNSNKITYRINSLTMHEVENIIKTHAKGLDALAETERVYDVTIDVYMGKSSGKKRDYNARVSYAGAEASNFPKDAKLATFTGRVTQ